MVISLPLTSYAGTADPNEDCPKKNNKQQEDSVTISESEIKAADDTQTLKIPKKKPVAKNTSGNSSPKTLANNLNEGEEDIAADPNSAMSFNFIYYIIDKFKFTDPL